MPAFLVRPEDVGDGELALIGEEARHLARARRHRPGDLVEALDGAGLFYRVRIEAIDRDRVRCRIVERLCEHGESPVRLHLAPALIKGPRFDLLVEKATEVGVASIHPLLCERGVVRPAGREERWQRLVQAAAKQCGRARLPPIEAPAPLPAVLARLRGRCQRVLAAAPGQGPSLRACLEGAGALREVGLLVGPEGGFSPAEEEMAMGAGTAFFSWGSRILRAETAGVVLAALVLHEAEAQREGS